MWIPKQLTKDLHIHLCRYFGNYVVYMIIQTFVCHNPVIYKFDDQKKKKTKNQANNKTNTTRCFVDHNYL